MSDELREMDVAQELRITCMWCGLTECSQCKELRHRSVHEIERLRQELAAARAAAVLIYHHVHDPEGRWAADWCDRWPWLETQTGGAT